MLDHVLSFKRNAKKANNKIVEHNFYLMAHIGSGFDSYIVITNLPQWRSVVNLIKNVTGFVSLIIFNGYVDEKKKLPQCVHFRCGKVHIKSSFKEQGISYKSQPLFLKQEMEHHENYEDTGEARENEWLPYVKNDVLSTVFSYARYSISMEELTGFGMKNSLTLPSLASNYFNSLEDGNDELTYTHTDPFMISFVRYLIKADRCFALIQ